MIEIEGPDGVIYEFPEGTSEETMRQALMPVYGGPTQQPAPSAPTASPEMAAGLAELSGMTQNPPAPEQSWGEWLYGNVVGNPDDGITNGGEYLGSWLNRAGESMTLGLVGDEAAAAFDPVLAALIPGRETGTYEENLAKYRQQEDDLGTWGRLSADVVGGILPALTGIGIAGSGATLGGRVAMGAGLGAGAGGVQGFMEGEDDLSSRLWSGGLGALAGGAIGGVIPIAGEGIRRMIGGADDQVLRAADVSGDDLKAQASALYDEARKLGVTASPADTASLRDTVTRIASDEGLISPTGRIAESYPRVRDIIRMVEDYAEGTMDPTQMQAVRRTIQGAAESADKAERRLGTIVLKAFDDFTEPLAPQFKAANALYRRAMLGEMGDTAKELAEIRSGQFSGSGLENARRTEYRGLDRKIAKGQLKGLTEDQIAAIQRVSRGTTGGNVARGIGKAAPTGVVSAALGGGMPFLVGNALGGPAAGAAAGLGAMGIGALGRAAATRSGRINAEVAEALLRSATGRMPEAPGRAAQSIIEALLQSAVRPVAGRAGSD